MSTSDTIKSLLVAVIFHFPVALLLFVRVMDRFVLQATAQELAVQGIDVPKSLRDSLARLAIAMAIVFVAFVQLPLSTLEKLRSLLVKPSSDNAAGIFISFAIFHFLMSQPNSQ